MKTIFKSGLVLVACVIWTAAAEEKPFHLAIVPKSRSENSSSISWTGSPNHQFFVVMTNTTDKNQPVFETWNSWGYQAVSFELILPSGKRMKASVKPQVFTRNFPSTYVIPPKGHQVFPISFNEEWELVPDFKSFGTTKIKLIAIYEIFPNEESKKKMVWTGRIVSETLEAEFNR
jgi:hypothetical protein